LIVSDLSVTLRIDCNVLAKGLYMIAIGKRLAPWLLVLALGVGQTACGGDDNGNGNGGSTGGGDTGSGQGGGGGGDGGGSGTGGWTGEYETGTDVRVTMWVDASDPDLAEFEAFREAAGASPVLYARITATNDGSAPDTSRFLVLTDGGGDVFGPSRIEVNFLCSHIARWIAAAATQTTELVNQYSALLADGCNGNTHAGPAIAPGETVTYYVAYEGDTEPGFERVFTGAGRELKR
jgi:hypothetical protein